MSFGVKQWRPKSIDDAVAATLELETYTKTGPGRKAHVGSEATVVATVRDADKDNLVEKLGNLLQQIERLEADQQSAGTEFRSGHRRSSE